VIVGCNPLSLLIARLFHEQGEPIVLIDTDQDACRLARETLRDAQVFASSALDMDLLDEAGLSSVGTFLAMTSNGEVNRVLAQRAAEEFQPPRVLAIFPSEPQPTATPNNPKIQQAFVSQMSLKTWIRYLNDSAVKLGETVLREEDFEQQQAHLQSLIAESTVLPLLIEREKRLQVASATDEWEEGDRLFYLLHDPKPQLLKRLGGSAQLRLSPEKLAEVESIPEPVAVVLEPSEESPLQEVQT
jgi:Trk K+ transport system NAD-binding subunit